MVLSKRERYVLAATIVAVAALVLDRFIVTPFLKRRADTATEKEILLREMDIAVNQFARRKRMEREWKEMLQSALASDVSQAESQILHAVRNWAQESGLTLSSVKPERVPQEGDMQEITFQAAGTGPMRSVARFVWQLETASLPLKVTWLQLGSRKEGADDLSLQVRISALYLPAGPEPSTEPGTGPVARGDIQ